MVNFVEAVGTAFQIQDDIIAVTSEEYKDERDVAEDVREGKRSLMVIKAIQKPTQKAADLTKILNSHTEEPKEVQKALKIIASQ